ncbi:glycosyltransferase family 4 protein [Alkalicoccobacillus gibsonii]|uniref:glycosyltransferase family 4 protein n=1 Tax=Alkalicoccobacillus gibsonii TaxID=79881 RepID=UPI003517C87D
MNVLTVNKFYYRKGGSETYLFALEEGLKKRAYNPIPFSMKDEKNHKSPTEKYFVDNIDYSKTGIIEKVKLAGKIIYSTEAKRNLNSLLDMNRIELAHLHIFQHQLSPSILFPLKKQGIPIVYTVHDLKMLCPNYKMLTNGSVCEKCKGGKFYNATLNKCTKNSYLKSAINTFEAYVHSFLNIYTDYIDHFITPSDFYRQKLLEWGVPENKVTFIPNFVDTTKYEPVYKTEKYFLYLGRLSEEKGIMTLLEAIKKSKENIQLKIVGGGPLENELEEFVISNNLQNKVTLEGFKSGEDLDNLISKCKAVVMPSEWYENGPLSLIESFAKGKIVIGSKIGGIPEHIDEFKNGFLFEPGNVLELSEKLNYVNNLEDEVIEEMGRNSRNKVEEIYNEDYHFKKLLSIYESVRK